MALKAELNVVIDENRNPERTRDCVQNVALPRLPMWLERIKVLSRHRKGLAEVDATRLFVNVGNGDERDAGR